MMRICSLVPSGTEMVYALGLGSQLVGRSHTCDYPEEASRLPVLTQSLRGKAGASLSTEINTIRTVSEEGVAHSPSFALDGNLLRDLKPDLILTQDICDVCAIDSGTVFEAAHRVLGYSPEFLAIRASTMDETLRNMEAIGQAARSAKASEVVGSLQGRIDAVRLRAARAPKRKVLCMEWGNPLRAAGLWVPDLVNMAGGTHGIVSAGFRSEKITWQQVEAFAPEIVLFMPCGWDLQRNLMEWESLRAATKTSVFVFDGRIPSRHGPRLVDVLEAFAEIIHPEIFSVRWQGNMYVQVHQRN